MTFLAAFAFGALLALGWALGWHATKRALSTLAGHLTKPVRHVGCMGRFPVIEAGSMAIGISKAGHVVLVAYVDDRPPTVVCLGDPESASNLARAVMTVADGMTAPDDASSLTDGGEAA